MTIRKGRRAYSLCNWFARTSW